MFWRKENKEKIQRKFKVCARLFLRYILSKTELFICNVEENKKLISILSNGVKLQFIFQIMIAGLGTFSKKNLNISLCFCFVCLQATGDSAYIGKPREGCSYINHVPAGSHSNNDNIQVDLRKYLAMTSCLN